jgi:two-component system, OmpR family, response regulator QseB
MRVLLVEDDLDFRRSLRDLLVKAGHCVDAVGDGLAALGGLSGADVVLADIGVPGMDGLKLLSQARLRFPRLPVLVMTGYDSPRYRIEARLRGAMGFLVKPFCGAELLAHLNSLGGVPRTVSALVVPEPGSGRAP